MTRGAPIASAVARAARALMVVVAWVLLATAPAFAHATLVRAEPVDGAMLATIPPRLSLSFSEPVAPLVLDLVRPDGSSSRQRQYAVNKKTIDIELPKTLGEGTHLFVWRVVSADGHPVSGVLTFSVGTTSAAPPVAGEGDDWLLRAAILTARLALALGLLLGVGGAFAMSWITRDQRIGGGAAIGFVVLGLVAAPLSLGLQGLDALGAPLDRLGQQAAWNAAMMTSFWRMAAIAWFALALGLLALASRGRLAKMLSLAALVGVGAAFAASGHAAAAEPQWLTRAMVFVHATAIAWWTGALIPLALTLKHKAHHASAALHRFSAAIPYVVAALVAAGIVLAIIQVEAPSALVETAYGRVLLLKLALVAVLLAIAAFNRWKLTAPALADDAASVHRLARLIMVETVIVVLVLATTALWRFTPPPRALAIAAAEPASIHIHTDKAMADLSITPGHAGVVEASIIVMTTDFGPLDAKAVKLTLSGPAAGAGAIERSAEKPGDGTWRVEGLELPAPGEWTVRIDISMPGSGLASLDGKIDIRP